MGVPLPKLTLAEYLAWEADQAQRHELYRGEVFAMVGGTRGHNRVIANLVRHVGNHLDGGPCQVFSDGMKVQVGDDTVLYPDVLVTCERNYARDQLVVITPLLIVEVLSPATEAYDRGKKFAMYRTLASLREYVLLDTEASSADVFRCDETGGWVLVPVAAGGVLSLFSIGLELQLGAVFQGMDGDGAQA
jgi:Uma2 family endonuclease